MENLPNNEHAESTSSTDRIIALAKESGKFELQKLLMRELDFDTYGEVLAVITESTSGEVA